MRYKTDVEKLSALGWIINRLKNDTWGRYMVWMIPCYILRYADKELVIESLEQMQKILRLKIRGAKNEQRKDKQSKDKQAGA